MRLIYICKDEFIGPAPLLSPLSLPFVIGSTCSMLTDQVRVAVTTSFISSLLPHVAFGGGLVGEAK